MNKFDFLYSDMAKFVPVQLKKINYGYAPKGGLQSIEDEEKDSNIIGIQLPAGDEKPYFGEGVGEDNVVGYVIFLFSNDNDAPFSQPILEDVTFGQPGETELNIKIPPTDKDYYIYVMSKYYEDGYIADNGKVSATEIEFAKAYNWKVPQINSNNIVEVINLTWQGAMIPSAEDTDMDEWYNWQGSYTSPDLIWEGGIIIDDEGDTDSTFTSANLLVGHEEDLKYPGFKYEGGGDSGRMTDSVLKDEYDATPTLLWESSRWKIMNQEPQQNEILGMVPIWRVWNWRVGASNDTGWYCSLSFDKDAGGRSGYSPE